MTFQFTFSYQSHLLLVLKAQSYLFEIFLFKFNSKLPILPFPFPTQRAATPGVLISAPGTGNPWTGPAPRFPASPSGDVLPGTP